MKKLFFITAVALLMSHVVQAETVKVIRAKGRQAVVDFPEGTTPKKGETYELNPDSGTSNLGGGNSRRAYTVGLSAQLSNLKNDKEANAATVISIAPRIGWNMEVFEAGPIALLAYAKQGTVKSTQIGLGGFFDYNLKPNRVGAQYVPGVGGEMQFVNTNTTTSSGSTDFSSTRFQAGGFIKAFMLGNAVALRGDAVYSYQKFSGSGGTTSGLLFLGGLQVYF